MPAAEIQRAKKQLCEILLLRKDMVLENEKLHTWILLVLYLYRGKTDRARNTL